MLPTLELERGWHTLGLANVTEGQASKDRRGIVFYLHHPLNKGQTVEVDIGATSRPIVSKPRMNSLRDRDPVDLSEIRLAGISIWTF
jgi:hypothetical protein